MSNFRIKLLCRKLKKWEKQNNAEKILPLIHSNFFSIRLESIKALGNIKCEKALPELIHLLNHKNDYIRNESRISILKIRKDKRILDLIEKAKAYNEKTKNEEKEKKIKNETIDKNLYSFKGRIIGNISRLQSRRNNNNRPIHYG